MFLIFNVGSASIKWALFNNNLEKQQEESIEFPNFDELSKIINKILEKNKTKDIAKIGHRVVHGGHVFKQPTRITENTFEKLEEINKLAPLHNPLALQVIRNCQRKLPKIDNFACFDTSFYKDLPQYAANYALPTELAEEHKIFRYGFHGISHQYVANQVAQQLKQPLENLKLITAHLGSGASLTAIEDAQPIDTTMGFTPLEGIIMSTRSGNIDPSIPIFLAQNSEYSLEKIHSILNKESGLLGISGISEDVRDIITAAEDPDHPRKKQAGLALQMFAYQIKKQIGAYTVALGGLDVLVLTGAVSQSDFICDMITHSLHKVLGKFAVLKIDTDEELAIAKKIKNL
ncbi:MAG: acetate/propionate family kinase [Patescibacteria group bacterium]